MRINITEYITRNNRKTIIVAIGIAIMLCVAVGIIMGTNAKKQENNGDNASVEIPSEQEDHNQKREESAENRLVPTQESNEINLSREQIVEKYYAFIEEVKDITQSIWDDSSEEGTYDAYHDEYGNPLFSIEGRQSYFQNPGYCILDVNDDGIPELLFGENDTQVGGDFDSYIYDMYTIHNGEILHVFSGGTRNAHFFTEDGKIGRMWFSSWHEGGFSFYEFDGEELVLIEEFDHFAEYPSEELIYTYRNPSGEKEFSEGEADHLLKTHPKQYIHFIPYGSEYTIKYGTIDDYSRPEYAVYHGANGYFTQFDYYFNDELVYSHEGSSQIYLVPEKMGYEDIDHDGAKEILLCIEVQDGNEKVQENIVLKHTENGWIKVE